MTDDSKSESLNEDDLRRRAERLIAEGRMPSLAQVMEVAKAVAEEAQSSGTSSRTSREGLFKRPAAAAAMPDRDVLTKPELRRFLGAAKSEPCYRAILFLAMTGVRLAEVMVLRWSDVDLEARTAMIRRAARLDAQPKPQFGRRTIDLSPILASEMAKLPTRHVAMAEPDYLVFIDPGAEMLDPDGVRDAIARAGRRAGIERACSDEVVRRTWAALMLEAGAPLNYVARGLGLLNADPALLALAPTRPGAAGAKDGLPAIAAADEVARDE